MFSFFCYDKVKLAEKSRDLIFFLIPFDLIQKTNFAQGEVSFVGQFVEILFKIQATYLQDWGRIFLNDVEIKSQKTTWNKKEWKLKIWHFIIKHIQNLN